MKALNILKINRTSSEALGEDKSIIAIYDEAIKELEDLQNRKCSNCKYATLDSARYLPIHKCFLNINGVDYNFYCNKWESK